MNSGKMMMRWAQPQWRLLQHRQEKNKCALSRTNSGTSPITSDVSRFAESTESTDAYASSSVVSKKRLIFFGQTVRVPHYGMRTSKIANKHMHIINQNAGEYQVCTIQRNKSFLVTGARGWYLITWKHTGHQRMEMQSDTTKHTGHQRMEMQS